MNMSVVNKYRDKYDVYIGRPSVFGNPYSVHEFGRDKAITMYEKHFLEKIGQDETFRKEVMTLKDKTLGCFCKPKSCHGDIIIKYLETI